MRGNVVNFSKKISSEEETCKRIPLKKYQKLQPDKDDKVTLQSYRKDTDLKDAVRSFTKHSKTTDYNSLT